jgi:hypothetical protein
MLNAYHSRTLLVALFLISAMAPAFATDITGTVVNKTTNKPAVGDDVILLKLQGGMQEVSRAKSDAQGKFTLSVPDANAMHLIRVNHRNVNYHRPAPPGTSSVEVDVYDADEKVEGVKQTFDIVRLEADATTLRITEDLVLENNSNPPKTLLAPRAIEVQLPTSAKMDESMAAGPGGMAIRISPVETGPGRYAFLFPIRPGEANFRIVYSLPYSGSAQIKPTVLRAADNYAVSIPKSMTLQPGASSRLQQKGEEMGMLVYVAENATPGQDVSYTVKGTGSVPQPEEQQQAENTNRPGGGMATPINTPDPLAKYRWWIIGFVALALVAGAGYVMSRREPAAAQGATSAALNGRAEELPVSRLLAAIKEEMFELERDRVEKKVSEAEYQRVRAALEVVLARAVDRQTKKAKA